MGGPNLEVFKFGLYLFVPVVALLHFGDPAWYHNHVLPVGGCCLVYDKFIVDYYDQYKGHLFPPPDRTYSVRFFNTNVPLIPVLKMH